MKTLEDDQYFVITAYNIAVFEIFSVRAIPTHRDYRLYDYVAVSLW